MNDETVLAANLPVVARPSTGKIAAALAKAQGEIQNPQMNKTVKVRTRGGDEYQFSYADLDAIIKAIKGPLAKNGISYVQTMDLIDDKWRLQTTLLHESGESLTSITPLFVEGQGNQAFGSALTYMKRYALAALVGVAADSDDDANSADGNTAQEIKKSNTAPNPPADNVIAIKPVELAEVPATPCVLAMDGEDWMKWGLLMASCVRSSKDVATLDQWVHFNRASLDAMAAKQKRLYTRLDNLLTERRKELANG